jgi:hypothetical protein
MMAKILIRVVLLAATVCLAPRVLSGEPPPGDSDALQANTVWTGTLSGDERKPKQDGERGARMKITSRDGEKFEAEFVVRGNATFALEFDGRIRDGQVAAKVTKIVKGRWPGGTIDDIWTGTLAGDELTLKHTSKQNLVSTAKLKLDPDASAAAGKRRKGK